VIRVRAGERVRLILKNEAPGLVHDIAIPAWNVAADSVRTGETAQVVFTVPTTPGRAEYRCRPHAEMMNGVVDVTP
jgi:plastocyanin